ncbi:phosphoribosyltransferase [Microvirga soli]|uniref:phosphoribosyltransferase n=1 Tax=Microvirga soli TaxID=1854496 RepID=UPI00191F9E0D|nr:phosphoribosyltransferase [Microvirga soli]
MPLKLVLISPNGTIGADGKARIDILDELVTFTERMSVRGVQVAFWSRHRAMIDGEPVHEYLSRRSGVPVRLFLAGQGGLPTRQRAGSVDPILAELGVSRHETVLVGNSDADVPAGVNNQLLLIRPGWYPQQIDYGFEVPSISSLAQFCEIFALREHPIYWSISDSDLHVRAMGPYSTYKPNFAEFSADAKSAAKEDGGQRRFWFLMIVSTLYFSGLIHQIDYLCAFPGHNPNSSSEVRKGLDALMTVFGKCFRKPYLADFILRHTPAIKSQYAKPYEKTFLNQLKTIHLNRYPRHYDRPTPPASPLRLTGKTVLVADDFCTNGRSLDVARAFIEAAGGKAILFSWLKTINTAFLHMNPDPQVQPFKPNDINAEPKWVSYDYHDHVVAPEAADEIAALLDAYKNWKWP